MKLSFSTLGCPDWSFGEVLARGREYSFDGVAFRGLGGPELDLSKVPEFSVQNRATTKRRLAEAGLAPSMILASAKLLADEATIESHMRLAESHIDIAAALGSPYVRVFGGAIPVGLSHAAAVRQAAARLTRLGHYAAGRGVVVLLETHDDFLAPELVARVMAATNHAHVGVLWDVHHPWRIIERPVAAAWETLRPWIKAVDLKDSTADFSARLGYRYVELGTGEAPIAEAVRLLVDGGYDGWLTFEWEKRWHPEIAGPEVSFPRFIATMRKMLGA